MKCDKCQQRPATVHVVQIVNGAKSEINLCEVCAQEQDNSPGHEPKWMLQNIFAELFNQQNDEHAARAQSVESGYCRQCGFSETQFARQGKLGCPQCYDVFANRLDPVLRRVHGNPLHTGKVPKRAGAGIGVRKEIEQLKLKLQETVAREEYERAAEIRDKIRALEKTVD